MELMATEVLAQVRGITTMMKTVVEVVDGIVGRTKNTKAKAEISTSLDFLVTAQNGILEIQNGLTAIVAENNELKKQVLQLKAWDEDKRNYRLESIAHGVFAYRYAPSEQPSKADHFLCCHCYDDGKKSILHFNQEPSRPALFCPACHTKYPLSRPPRESTRTRRG
jgi:hypothetical protein